MRWKLVGIAVSTAIFAACKKGGPTPVDTDTDTDLPADTDTDTDPGQDTASEPGPPWDLTVIGQGYQGGNGFEVRVRMATEELVLVGERTDTIEGGGWMVRFRDTVDPAEPGYWVGWWIDLNGNGDCGAGDVAVLETVTTGDGDIVRVHTYSPGAVDPVACNGF
ncbi:MAG: hypothetical protein H6737_26300 [Alphaproteobacteria bacterium]|nr:hypothetical protein [Alphaproteobacteria bacterium]